MTQDMNDKITARISSLLLLLLMLVLGGVKVWAQEPVEITTDEEEDNNTEKLYLIQTNQFQSFYMIPNGTNVSTVNLPNNQMLWYFKNAGTDNNGTQYYYIVNKSNSLYICHGGGTVNTTASRSVTLVEKTSSNDGRCKFKIVEDNSNGTEGFYNISTITSPKYYALNKQSGSVSSQNNIRLTDNAYAHDLNSKWKFIRFNGTFTWPAPPFTPSTDSEKYFYKINSKIKTSFNISSNYLTTDNKVTFASTSSDNMVWYFKEVPSELVGESSSWYKYYYIVNQNSDGQYMYYDGTATDGSDQTDAVSLKEKSEVNEDRYQFVIVQAAKTDKSDQPMECYMIVPKLLRGILWNSNSIGPDDASDGNVMDIIKGRVNNNEITNNYAHVTFVSVEPCAEPTISLDPSTNKVIIFSTEGTGSSLYYTIADGIVDAETLASPTRADNQYNSPIALTSTKTIKAVTVKNDFSKAKSNSVTKTIVYNPTITLSGGPWTYDKTAKEPSVASVMVGETSIPSTDYDVTYANNVNAGTTAAVTIRDNTNSEYLIYGTQNFTISQAPLSVTANNHSITYGDAPAGNGVTYEGFVEGDDESKLGGSLDYDYSYTQYDDVGDNYTITPKGLTSSNYNISYVAGTLTVTPKALTITADAKEKTYGDDDPALTYTSEGLVGSDAITGALSREAGENVGTYAINQNTVTAGTNYNISYTGANLTINKKALTVTANPKTIIYGNGPTNNGVTYSGFVSGEDKSVLSGTLAYTYNYEQYGDVGNTYTITPGGLTGANYNISFVAGTLTVNPREVGLTWSETTSFVYDGEEHVPTATATSLVNGDAVAVNVTGKQTSAGNYTATASSLTGDKAGNYKLPDANTQEFSITKVVLTVTANDNTITYGDAPAGNGVTYEGFVNSETASVLGGTLDYDYSYTKFGNVGDYTITPKGLTSDNYDISFVAGTLTVGQKEVGLIWGETTSFPYDGSAHAPTATATGLVNSDAITVTVTGAQTNAGNYTATASALTGVKAGNYKLPAANAQSFTISRKSLGEGTLAEGYILDFGEGNTILLTDDAIGSALAIGTDYSVSDDSDPSDKYSKRTVIGIGNYTGTFDVRNVVISFTTDTEQEEWSATFAAEDTEGFNLELGLALPEGVSAFIISDIRGDWAIPEPLNYIPKGVPVLLVAHKPIYGFVPTKAENGDVTPIPITDDQEDRNMLEEVTEATPGYDPVTESAHFATKQIYILYKNEFVFNKAGDMKKGKVYLNPNHTATSSSSSSSSAPARLLIGWNDTTGMEDVKWKKEDGRSERWYTLDGRRLSGKPTAKGVYIVGGKKIVVK